MATFHRNGGNFGPEWVATFKRNGGSFAPDYAGGVHEGEDCRTAALRELSEETGYIAKELTLLGRFYPSPGTRGSTVHVYVTHSVEAGTPSPDEHEIIEVVLMPWDNVLKLVLAEQAVDASLAYAVLRYGATR